MYLYGRGTFCEVYPPLRLKWTAQRFLKFLDRAKFTLRIFLDSDRRTVGQKQIYSETPQSTIIGATISNRGLIFEKKTENM